MTAQMGNTQNLYLLMEAITLVTMNGWCILRLPTKKQTKKCCMRCSGSAQYISDIS